MDNNPLVSVLLVTEVLDKNGLKEVAQNIFDQNYENIELLISYINNVPKEELDAIKDEIAQMSFNIRWFESSGGVEIFNNLYEHVNGDFVFYRTIDNIRWKPRHIESHLENYNQKRNASWLISHLEYKNIEIPDHPLNTIGYRVADQPKVEEIFLDEISHKTGIECDWGKCVVQTKSSPEPIFLAGLVLKEWVGKGIIGSITDEITVIEWINPNKNNPSGNEEDVKMKVGLPASQEIKDEPIETDEGLEIVRKFPTVMGNVHLDELHNNGIRNQISKTQNIKSIAIKRTMGIGDVVVVEPIIKKLKEKYPEAKVSLYTAKPNIIKYFVNQPDEIVEIETTSLLQDTLYESDAQIKFDLDLSYESRTKPRTSFIDAYSQVCGLSFDGKDDKKVQLDKDKCVSLGDHMPKGNYVVVVPDGSGWRGKTWDYEKYKVVIQWLLDEGYEVIEPSFEYHSGLTDPKWHKATFEDLVSLIANCHFYLGGDNGPMHIARGFNKPCVLVAGACLPYYTNPNRENVFYVQHNSAKGLGFKHDTFFKLVGDSVSFVAEHPEDPRSGLDVIQAEDVIACIKKFEEKPKSTLTNNEMDFYFNIPKWSYYKDSKTGLIERERINEHPDQDEDIFEQYAYRWEQVYNDHAKTWVTMLEEEYQKHNVDIASLDVLDVGCNIGLTVKAFNEKNHNAIGIDMNEPSINKGLEMFENHPISKQNFLDIDSEAKFDIVTSDQVFEHISNPNEYLDKCYELLKDNGLVFIGTPNFNCKEAQMQMQLWGQVGTGEHTFLYTNESFKWVIENHGKFEFEFIQDVNQGIVAKLWKK